MVYGDDILLSVISEQKDTIEGQAAKIRELSEEITLLRAGERAERCTICGAIIPEGRQVCRRCELAVEEAGV